MWLRYRMPALNKASTIAKLDKLLDQNDQVSFSDVVIVGAGMAGSRLAIKLATLWKDTTCKSPKITLISKEKEVGYNRIMLSPVLAGETAFETTYLYDKQQYQQLDINVLAGVSVDKIDTKNQQLSLDSGDTLGYGKLVIATGSTARVIPFPNHQAKGVHVFRDVADVAVLTEYAKQGKTGLVIGGGVLGLEAACALSLQGAAMSVVHVDNYVLNRQLDQPAAMMLQQELLRRKVKLETSASTTTIEVNSCNEVTGLSLQDGRTLPADFIVMAVGIIPNTKLAIDAGLKVNRGILVDEYMHTSAKNVYAIGECVEINEELFGMVSSVNQHVEVLLQVLTEQHSKQQWLPFISVPLALKLKVSGIAVFSSGKISFDETELEAIEKIEYRHIEDEHYQCLYIKDNHLVGVVLYGETGDGNFYSQLINEQIDISKFKQDLIFGTAYCQSLLEQNDGTVSHTLVNSPAKALTGNENNKLNLEFTSESATESASETDITSVA